MYKAGLYYANEVAGVLFSPLFVCFSRRYLKNQCS